MNPCSNCLENNWTYKHKEGMIIATCNLCGYEVEFKARKKSLKLQEGSPCKKCKTPIIYKASKYKENKLKKAYYYTGYYKCPRCKTIYYSDKFKIINNPN